MSKVAGCALGVDVHRTARICAAGHGGQILLSQTTRELVTGGIEAKDLGSYSLAGLPAPERLFQLLAVGLRSDSPLRAESGRRRRLTGRLRGALPASRRSQMPARQLRQRLPKVAAPSQRPLVGSAPPCSPPTARSPARSFLAASTTSGSQAGWPSTPDRHYSRQAVRKPTTQTRISCVEQLEDGLHALASLAPQLLDRTRRAPRRKGNRPAP